MRNRLSINGIVTVCEHFASKSYLFAENKAARSSRIQRIPHIYAAPLPPPEKTLPCAREKQPNNLSCECVKLFRTKLYRRRYEKDVCHINRGAGVAVCRAQRSGGRATTLDSETREGSRRGYRQHDGERHADSGPNDLSSDAPHSPRAVVANNR